MMLQVKSYSILLCALLLFAAGVGTLSADIIERVKIDDLYYHLNTETRTAEVTWEVFDGISITTNYIGLTSVDIPSSVSYNGQTYTAEFAKNTYTITDQSDNVQGAVCGAKQGSISTRCS